MSTLTLLKDAVKGFVYNNSNYTDKFQGGTSAVSMEAQIDAALLVAINNARLWAERNHDFAFTKVSVPVSLTSAGLDINNLGVSNTRMKKIVGVDVVTTGGGTMPLLCTTKQDLRIKLRNQDRIQIHERYPGSYPSALMLEPRIIVDGLQLNSYPGLSTGQSMDIIVHGYQWLERYAELDGTTDWLIQNGFDFMMWQSVLEVNHIVNVFVPRQEGSLSPPEKLRDEAWSGLVIVDSDITGGMHGE